MQTNLIMRPLILVKVLEWPVDHGQHLRIKMILRLDLVVRVVAQIIMIYRVINLIVVVALILQQRNSWQRTDMMELPWLILRKYG